MHSSGDKTLMTRRDEIAKITEPFIRYDFKASTEINQLVHGKLVDQLLAFIEREESRIEVCPHCTELGHVDYPFVKCPNCKGKGWIK